MASDSSLHAFVIHEPPSLEEMVGLDTLPSNITLVQLGAQYRSSLESFGVKVGPGFQNALVVGPQGTGKTTYAKILAFEYRKAGLISAKSPILFLDAIELAGEYTGQSEERTKKLLHSNVNSVIILDEIDSLMNVGSYGFSVLNVLNAHMGNSVNSPIIIATCYASRKEEFLRSNKGLEGRFRHIIHMPEYSLDDLADMYIKKIINTGFIPGNGIHARVKDLLTQVKKAKGSLFANAREVQNIFDATLDAHALRLTQEGLNFSHILEERSQ